MFKRFIAMVLMVSFLCCGTKAQAESFLNTGAEACVLMYEDGQCLYEKNADRRMLVASTTKLMTAIVCIENCRLDDTVKIKTEHYLSGQAGFLRAETTAAARVRGVDFTQVRSLSYICVKSGSLPCAGIDQTRAIISP
jgi:D-alanyl-D-alanine carboxypeptidase